MRCLIVVCALMALAASAAVGEDKPKLWALLVAGSNEWYNYRHQADVCHAYQVLHAHGIPDENIVVMMYDDIANNRANPTKGIVINHPNGKDVYKGVPKDYIGKDVTPQNFLNVLLGKKDAMKGIGSGKVIESGPNDHVFVNFVDHGATGLLAFPMGELTVKELNDALKQLHEQNRYNKLVLYIEACESGSMFRNVLPADMNIFATTASDYNESSYACYYDSQRGTYLGDWYSVNWMEDSDSKDIEKETLQTQFQIVKKVTTTSHVQEYGDISLGQLPVGEFQGEKEAPSFTPIKPPYKKGSASWDVAIDILYMQLDAATTETEKTEIVHKIEAMQDKRDHVDAFMRKIVLRVAQSLEHQERLTKTRPMTLTNLDCHTKLVHGFSNSCFNFGKNTYALKYAYVLANMCEQGFDADVALRTMSQVCKDIVVREGIH
jgi:legumain